MSTQQSLRRRIVNAFSIFAVVMIVVLVACFHALFHYSEDRVLVSQLEAELEHVLAHPELLEQRHIQLGRFITCYVGLDAAPADLTKRLAGLQPGAHELVGFDAPYVEEEIHVLVTAVPGRAEKLFLVSSAPSFNDLHLIGPLYLPAILLALLLVALVGAMTGRILAGMVVRPLSSLAGAVGQGSLETLAERIDPEAYAEELGVLATALQQAATRLQGFVTRERQFTANASHELRTPVTVIRGACELLADRVDAADAALTRPLQRIERAVSTMEETIELFLALARENELALPEEGCLLAEVVDDVVSQQRHLLADRPVGIVVRVPKELRIAAPPRVLAIVLGNLVGNAFRRTSSGSVSVLWRDSRLEVIDTGPGIPAELGPQATSRHVSGGSGHGLGLDIVSALCDRYGWQLELQSAEGVGTCAVLVI